MLEHVAIRMIDGTVMTVVNEILVPGERDTDADEHILGSYMRGLPEKSSQKRFRRRKMEFTTPKSTRWKMIVEINFGPITRAIKKVEDIANTVTVHWIEYIEIPDVELHASHYTIYDLAELTDYVMEGWRDFDTSDLLHLHDRYLDKLNSIKYLLKEKERKRDEPRICESEK